jgi:hypothetical protein
MSDHVLRSSFRHCINLRKMRIKDVKDASMGQPSRASEGVCTISLVSLTRVSIRRGKDTSMGHLTMGKCKGVDDTLRAE